MVSPQVSRVKAAAWPYCPLSRLRLKMLLPEEVKNFHPNMSTFQGSSDTFKQISGEGIYPFKRNTKNKHEFAKEFKCLHPIASLWMWMWLANNVQPRLKCAIPHHPNPTILTPCAGLRWAGHHHLQSGSHWPQYINSLYTRSPCYSGKHNLIHRNNVVGLQG